MLSAQHEVGHTPQRKSDRETALEYACFVHHYSQTLNQRDEMGVPGVAQEGSRVVSQGALAAFSGPWVTTMACLGSQIEASVAQKTAKRDGFERVLFPGDSILS